MGRICRYLADQLVVICLFRTFLVLEPTSQLFTQQTSSLFQSFSERNI